MGVKVSKQQVIDTIQWIAIIVLILLCACIYVGNQKHKIALEEERKQTTYTKIYESQRLSKLKKENEILYDSIKKMQNAKNAIEIRYIYKHTTDTVYVQQTQHNHVDSLYTYKQDNDTVSTNVSIKAKDLRWLKVDTKINDKFTIINAEKDGVVTTKIDHSPNVTIEGTTTWNKKQTFADRFHHGPVLAGGYGVFNQNFDLFVGYGVMIEF